MRKDYVIFLVKSKNTQNSLQTRKAKVRKVLCLLSYKKVRGLSEKLVKKLHFLHKGENNSKKQPKKLFAIEARE